MASEKRPSVYSDRGSFGSAEELDEYGVWIKCEPQDMSLTNSDDLEDTGLSMPDFENSTSDIGVLKGFDPSELGEIELPENDFSIEKDDNLPNEEAFVAEENAVGNFDEFPITGGAVDAAPLVTEDDFEVPTVESIETSSRIKESDISNQLLQKIANELSSIRNELAEMKKEFAIVRAASPASEAKEDDQHGGFFSEEEDETIALTGDELNNILNTADFTEESGANETPDDATGDTAPIDGAAGSNKGTAEAEDGGDELIQIDLDSLGIDLNPDVPAVDDLPMEEDELEKLRTEGAVPINPVPENISYLEESEIADITDNASINSSSFDIIETAVGDELADAGVEDDLTESLTDNIAGDDIGMDSLDYLTITGDSVETEEAAAEETADDDLDSLADISIEAESDDGHDIVLPMPEENMDIDMLTDDGLDISILEDDFTAPPIADDGADSLSEPEESMDIDMLTDDGLDISILEDDFTAPPIADDGADSLSEPEESMDIDMLTDDGLDISIPEDDFTAPPIADDDLSIPEDDFAALPETDDGADSLPMPEESVAMDMLTDDSLDMSIPDDDFAALPEADDFAMPPMADDGLSMPDDDFAMPPMADDGLSMPDDDFAALPEADDFAMPPMADDGLSMPDDDFAALPEADDFAMPPMADDGLPMPDDDFAALPEADDFAMPQMADDGLPMPDDDFAALPEADDFAMPPMADDGLSMPDDDFAALPEADDFAMPPMTDDELPMPDDDFAALPEADDFAMPPAADDSLSTPKDSIENIIPEDFESGIKDSPVPFDDDLKDELAVHEMSSLLGATSKARPEKRVKTPVVRDVPSETETADKKKGKESDLGISPTLKNELKTVLSYMDRLLDSLPEEKIAEFAKSEYFDSYKKLFKELGLV